MNSKKFVIIIAVVLVVTISAGFVIANQQQNPDGRQQSDRSSTVPVNSPVPTLITKSEDLLQQALADPTVEKTSPIATEKARDLARKNFPEFTPDRVNITYNHGDRNSQASVEFDIFRENKRLVQGGLDPETGNLTWYAIPVERIGRLADPSVTIDSARIVSDNELRKRNGIISFNISSERYDPLGMPDSGVAGVYVFVYERLVKSDRCDSDGFTIDVDSVSGKVIEYRKTWVQSPESIC
ncbi:MAG: hypothetical protein WC295_00265 [Methanoregula sp.]|jgi:hypothetical protein